MDFRDHHIKKALDEAIPPYRPEKTLRARIRRMAVIAALALATFLGIAIVIHYSIPKPAPGAPDRKPIQVQLLPAPARP